jgi:carboxyl-terminal processing protease
VARYYTPLGRNIQKPYKEGYDKYEEEVTERFHNGEVIKGDTTRNTGPSFKTKKGRLVYGGGGITPDIYVPFDTTSMGKEVIKLYTKATLSNFIYTYYMQHKTALDKFKKPADLAQGFKAGDAEWQALKAFAAKDTIDVDKISPKEKAELLRRMPALVARQLWRYEGYYQVMNATDEFLQKALQAIR